MIMNKTKHNIKNMKDKSLKALLGYINSFFSQYGIKVAQKRKSEKRNENMVCYYRIEIINNVDELLEYKIKKGFQLNDDDDLFVKPSTIEGYIYKYNELVNPIVDTDFDDNYNDDFDSILHDANKLDKCEDDF